MPLRRLLAVALALVVPVALMTTFALGAVPSSIGLIYYKEKNFKLGDWVLYKVTGANMEGEQSVDYQRVQAVLEENYMGEPCVWIETGFGKKPGLMDWSAAEISENAFQDTIAYLRPNFYLRRLHTYTDETGVPRAAAVNTFNPKIPLPSFDSRRPVIIESRWDTLDTPKGRIACWYTKSVRTHKNTKSNPDGTIERGVESTVERWINPEAVPLTGIVREVEHKEFKTKAWPIGKLSTDYAEQLSGFDDLKTELVDFGHDAKPRLAHRIKDARDRRQVEVEP
jgi:hypothetical protein